MDDLKLHGLVGGQKPKGTALSTDVRAGETFMNGDGEQIGTLPDRGNGQTINPGTGNKVLQAGIYNGDITVLGDSDLVSGNIKAGADIFGVPGKASVVDTSQGNAQASQIMAGIKAYSDGSLITGTMPNNGTLYISPGTSNQAIPKGYHNGSGIVYGDVDLVASNIRNGVRIFGVNGSLQEGTIFQSGSLQVIGSAPTTDGIVLSVSGSGWLIANTGTGSYVGLDIIIDGVRRYVGTGIYRAIPHFLRFETSLQIANDYFSDDFVFYLLD